MKITHKLTTILSIVLTVGICTNLNADTTGQNIDTRISFTHFYVNDGLSQGTVVSSCQDSTGHMWFATMDGLNRYDGYRFKVYRHDPDDTTSIHDNIIRKVYLDSRGDLWVGTAKGFALYDRKKDCFRNVLTGEMTVTGIAEASEDGTMLIAAGGSLRFFNRNRWEWNSNGAPYQSEKFGATIMYRAGDNIWIGTANEGLFCYSTVTEELKRISTFKVGRSIQCMISEDNDRLWIATEGEGLYLYNHRTGNSRNFQYSKDSREGINADHVRTLCKDLYGRLWVGTVNGLNILEDGRFIQLQSDPFIQGSLSHPSVRCISRDYQGGMWLGTWFGGLNYWHPLKNRFTNIQRQPNGNSLNDNVISCIAEDSDNSLWIGTNSGGVNHYDSTKDRFSYFSMRASDVDGNKSNDIKAIYIDDLRGLVFVGAQSGGLSIINKRTGSVHHCREKGSSNVPMDVYAVTPADENTLWIGTLTGLKSFDIRTHEYRSIDSDINGNPIKQLRIRSLLKDSRDRLWVGGEKGLICLQNTEKGLKPHALLISDETLNSAFIQCIYENATRLIWIGTRQGLYCYDDREGQLVHYSSNDGLPSDIIHGIEEDSYGRLWVSTDRGLSCFNPFSGIFRNYTMADGLQSNQFNTYSHCRRSNGEMLFGGVNGITAFTPETMEDNPYMPQPVLTSFLLFNKTMVPGEGVLTENIETTEEIRLKHDQNSFTIEFSVPNYLAGHHNTFRYMLEGFDKEWYETGAYSVSYSNLPHGHYRFLIKAANNDGKWNDTPTELSISIKPMWYQTPLANAAFAVLIILLIVGAYMIIVERKERESRLELDKQEKAHQEDIHQMKMRFFINISHEMRTPLTLIINPLQEMIAKSTDAWMRKQLKYLERNAKRLLHLVNQLMDYRRAELGVFKLNVRPENVHKIIKENWTFYEKLAQSKKIKYSLVSDLEGQTLYTDGQYLEIILNNLLSNAFKYTESGDITVKVTKSENNLILEVSDTGTGIPAGKQDRIFERFYQVDNEHIGSGIGLSLVQRLVELHHGQIRLRSEEGKGSAFTILLPLQLSAYSAEELGNSNSYEIHTSNTPEMYVADADGTDEDTPEVDNKKRGRLLIAEDNEDIRNYMKNGLKNMFDIMLAKNGEEALHMLKENEPDIVITDMMMPVMDGLKLCAQIKQNINTSHIPVIMVSAKTDSKDQLEALKTGADDYIAKPFSMAILVTKIRNILRTYHRLQDKATKSMDIAPEKISFNILDEQLLNKAISIVQQNMDNTEFSTEEFAQAMNMSRSNLHIKLKALTGESALDFIRKIRFKEACRLLNDGRYSISEISDMVGFNTPSYFATCFKKYMGCLPTEYVKKNA